MLIEKWKIFCRCSRQIFDTGPILVFRNLVYIQNYRSLLPVKLYYPLKSDASRFRKIWLPLNAWCLSVINIKVIMWVERQSLIYPSSIPGNYKKHFSRWREKGCGCLREFPFDFWIGFWNSNFSFEPRKWIAFSRQVMPEIKKSPEKCRNIQNSDELA